MPFVGVGGYRAAPELTGVVQLAGQAQRVHAQRPDRGQSKPALFRAAWQAYPNIDYRASQKVIGVDTSTREVRTEFDRVRYDVLNLIPPQRAGAIAVQADLVGGDKRWCEVNHVTYESVKQPGIHVIGDATIGLPVPKSGNVAMPIIAGLDAGYLKKQIEADAAGKRLSAEMEPYAKQVLDLGVDDVAAYFAARRREPTPVTSPADAIARGSSAAAQCASCHGPRGQGDAARGIPGLAGQAPGYLREQLLLFKAERRSPGDPAVGAVKAMLKTIPDDTFADLAAYYSSLR